jgi:recombination protein RecA
VAPPFKKAEFDLMFNEGISLVGELIDLGVEQGVLTKSGSWYSYDGNKLAQGRDGAKRVLRDNPDLAAEIEEKLMAVLKK